MMMMMTLSKVLCLNLFLLLSVHGLEVVARIRFQSSHYTVSEGNSTCVPVESMSPPASQDFAVSYSFDSILVGSQGESQMAPSLQGSIRFRAGTSVANLCFSHFDDEIACEEDIVGKIRLINSSAVIIVEPSVATVTIQDNDPAFVGFKSSSYEYTEDQVIADGLHPIIQSSHPSQPITLNVREAQHSDVFVSSSLTVSDTSLTIEGTEESFPLSLTDDDVALEAPEVIILEALVPDQLCSPLQLLPYNQTQITIVDNDEVEIGLTESGLTVQERERSVVVCVRISKRVARPLAFRLTTSDGTAFGGEDYGTSDFTGQFMAFSDQTEICYEIPISFDSVVEPTESFSVQFSMETSLSNEVRQKLSVSNAATNIDIRDSSGCFRVVLDQSILDSTIYIPELSTVCFDCSAPSNTMGGAASETVLWQLDNEQLQKNDQFSNGHVLNNGTLLVTDSSKTFSFKEAETALACSNSAENGQELVHFRIALGAPPNTISLIFSELTDSTPPLLTCVYEGVPQPTVEWLLNGKSLPEDHTHSSQAVSGDESRYRSVLTLPKDAAKDEVMYECVCTNQFGPSSSSITLQEEQPVSMGINGGCKVSMTVELLLSSLLLLLALL